jgi:hypothetical protein
MNTWSKFEKLLMVFLILGVLYTIKSAYDGYHRRSNVSKYGVYDIAIVFKKVHRKSASQVFFYSFDYKGVNYVSSDLLDGRLSKKIFVGDTILIRYTQKKPRFTVVDEKYRYVSCYGIPPQNSWKKRPKCATYDDVEYNTENTLFSFPETIKTQ